MKVNLQSPANKFVRIIRKVLASALLCRIAVTVCAVQLVSCGGLNLALRNSPAVLSNRSAHPTPFEQGMEEGTNPSVNGSGDEGDGVIYFDKSLAADKALGCTGPSERHPVTGPLNNFMALAISACPSSALLGISGGGEVVWWDPNSEQPFEVLQLGKGLKIAALAPSGLAAYQDAQGEIQVLNVWTGTKLYSLNAEAIRGKLADLKFTNNYNGLLIAEYSGRLLKVSLSAANLRRTPPIVEGYSPRAAILSTAGASPDGAAFVATWDGDISGFEALSHHRILNDRRYAIFVSGVAVARESKVSAGRHGAPVIEIGLSSNGEIIAAITENGDLEIWSVRGLIKRSELLNKSPGRPLALSITDGVIAMLTRDQELVLLQYEAHDSTSTKPPTELLRRKITGANSVTLGNNGVGYVGLDSGKVLQLNYGRLVKKIS